MLADHVEAAFGGALGALLGHQAAGVRLRRAGQPAVSCESAVGREAGGRSAAFGPVPTQTWHTPGRDPSWAADWREFTAAIREGRPPLADGRAGLEAVRMAYAVYEANATGRTVRL